MTIGESHLLLGVLGFVQTLVLAWWARHAITSAVTPPNEPTTTGSLGSTSTSPSAINGGK